MLIFASITMRDLMSNYRNLLKRKDESDSDTESQPLMSSSCSSPQDFGTVKEQGIFSQDSLSSESDTENFKAKFSTSPLIPISSFQKPLERELIFPPSYQNSNSYEIYSNHQNSFYNNFSSYPPINDNTPLYDKNFDAYANYKDIEDEETATNNSIVTIFAIWNTTMGSSLLAMSWGLAKSGLLYGIIINILIAALCLYTAYVLLSVNEKHGMLGQANEVSDLCRMLIGPWSEYIAKIFSLIILIGANIVYWILMSNFLYNSINFIYGYMISPSENCQHQNLTVICPSEFSNNTIDNPQNQTLTTFDYIWNLYSTVPIFLAFLMFPMLNFKSPTFFTKFNSLGTFSVLYLIIFVAIKSFSWGINIPNWSIEFELKPTFSALSGMLSMSYFIHNIVISIMRNNKRQEHNGRDLSIAFGLITFTYLFIGVAFYICFPLAKSCIQDNILNNFDKNDPLTLLARILLLFQLFTVFPLMSYMLRVDILSNINLMFKNYRFGDFTYGRVMIINVTILFICIMFACFLPRIGTLIRYTGALSGLVYIFMLPSLLKIASLRKEGELTTLQYIFHILIIIIGILNLFSQFFITD